MGWSVEARFGYGEWRTRIGWRSGVPVAAAGNQALAVCSWDAGGFIGTLVLTTVLRAASELRMTRLDLPFLLGTMVTGDRLRAKALGYLFHFFFGLFALGYYAIFRALGRAGWLPGAAFGLVHAMFSGSAS